MLTDWKGGCQQLKIILDNGCDDYLTKPFRKDQLLSSKLEKFA